jgi:hypothetical protein
MREGSRDDLFIGVSSADYESSSFQVFPLKPSEKIFPYLSKLPVLRELKV